MSAKGTPRKKRRKPPVKFQVLPVQVMLSEENGVTLSCGMLLFGITSDHNHAAMPIVLPGDSALGHQLTRAEVEPLARMLFGHIPVPEVTR